MRALAAVMLVVTVAAAGDEWPHPRGNLRNTGVVKNKGPKKTPKVKWKREEKGSVQTGAALADGLLVYPVGDRAVICRWQSGGREEWTKVVKQPVVSWPSMIGAFAYFGGQDHMHYRIRMTDGKEPTSHEAKTGIVADSAVTEDHYLAGATDGFFYAMGPGNGKLLWSKEIGSIRHGAAVDRKRTYVVNEAGVVYAFELKRGKEIWKLDTKGKPIAAPILSKTEVLVVLTDRVQRITLKTGKPGLSHDTPGIASAPVLDRSLLHYGNTKGEVVTLDLKSGKETARTKIADGVVTTPLILARKILYGAVGATLFGFDPKSRKLLWTYKGEEPFRPPIVAGGAVYVGVGDVFYCLK